MVKDQCSTSVFFRETLINKVFVMGGNGITCIESSVPSCLNIHLSMKPFNRKGGISKCLRIPAQVSIVAHELIVSLQ